MISLCKGARQVETDLTHLGAVVHEENTQIGIFAMNTANATQQKKKKKLKRTDLHSLSFIFHAAFTFQKWK